ncbi:hypothetical protein [Polaribacter atrinae]|uniref:hypothetical protein n=1 Tax=Polaribacter atrinae TaxID=1333662 RepID=UPI0030F874A6
MTEDRTIKFIKDVLLNGNNPRGKEAENNLRWGLQEYLKEQLKLYGVVQQSELLKSDGTLKYSFWIEKYFIKVEDNKYKAKGNHYGIVYYTERELRGKYARLYRK